MKASTDDYLFEGIGESCPVCGHEIHFGFGFYGGGYGGYKMCLSDACDWMEKDEEEVEG